MDSEFEFSNRNPDNQWESINMRIVCANVEGIIHIESMLGIVIDTMLNIVTLISIHC